MRIQNFGKPRFHANGFYGGPLEPDTPPDSRARAMRLSSLRTSYLWSSILFVFTVEDMHLPVLFL